MLDDFESRFGSFEERTSLEKEFIAHPIKLPFRMVGITRDLPNRNLGKGFFLNTDLSVGAGGGGGGGSGTGSWTSGTGVVRMNSNSRHYRPRTFSMFNFHSNLGGVSHHNSVPDLSRSVPPMTPTFFKPKQPQHSKHSNADALSEIDFINGQTVSPNTRRNRKQQQKDLRHPLTASNTSLSAMDNSTANLLTNALECSGENLPLDAVAPTEKKIIQIKTRPASSNNIALDMRPTLTTFNVRKSLSTHGQSLAEHQRNASPTKHNHNINNDHGHHHHRQHYNHTKQPRQQQQQHHEHYDGNNVDIADNCCNVMVENVDNVNNDKVVTSPKSRFDYGDYDMYAQLSNSHNKQQLYLNYDEGKNIDDSSTVIKRRPSTIQMGISVLNIKQNDVQMPVAATSSATATLSQVINVQAPAQNSGGDDDSSSGPRKLSNVQQPSLMMALNTLRKNSQYPHRHRQQCPHQNSAGNENHNLNSSPNPSSKPSSRKKNLSVPDVAAIKAAALLNELEPELRASTKGGINSGLVFDENDVFEGVVPSSAPNYAIPRIAAGPSGGAASGKAPPAGVSAGTGSLPRGSGVNIIKIKAMPTTITLTGQKNVKHRKPEGKDDGPSPGGVYL